MSQALYRTCYNPSFVIKLSLVVKLAVSWLSPPITPPTRYTSTVIPFLIFSFHLLIAISCISIVAYLRFQAGPFTLLNCSPIPLLRYADQSSTSIFAALWSFLSDVTSSELASSTESFTNQRETTKKNLPTPSVARTLTLTRTDDAVMIVPDTNDTLPSQNHPRVIRTSHSKLYSNPMRLFQLLFVQSLSHAALGAFFGTHLLFAFQAPRMRSGIVDYLQNYMKNDMTIAVQLAGVASFLASFEVIRLKSDINLRNYTKFVYEDYIDYATANKVIINIMKSIWNESKGIFLASITRIIIVELLLIGSIVSYLLLGSTSRPVNYSTSSIFLQDVSYIFLLQLAARQMIYMFKYLAICTTVYLFGLCTSIFVDTMSRVILSQPIIIKSLCKEYKRIISRKAQKRCIGSASASQSLTSSFISDGFTWKIESLPVQTRLVLDCTTLLLGDCTTAKACRSKLIDILVGAASSDLHRNSPFASFGLNTESLEVHKTENAMHLLVESWLCSTVIVVGSGVALPLDLYRELLLESLGGDDELSLLPGKTTYSSTSMISARHVSSIESCLSTPDSGIIISRCLITVAGAYGKLLTEISFKGSKELLFPTPSLVSQAEMCIRAAARMILVSTQFSGQYSRQSLMVLALLRAAYRLHLGASCYANHVRELLHKDTGRDVVDATPRGQYRQQMKASKASYIIQEVAGSSCNMQNIRRQLCAYEIDQMKGYLFSPVFVYRLLVAADEAVVLLASSGVFFLSNNYGRDKKHNFIGATNNISGLDRGCQAWINEVLLVASSVDGDPEKELQKLLQSSL